MNSINSESPDVVNEPLLSKSEDRLTLFPIKDGVIFESAKKQLAALWTAEEIDLSSDRAEWEGLTQNEQKFIKNVLAFFAVSDGIVSENILTNFAQEVQLPEARYAYAVQAMVEMVHAETYSLLIDTYVTDPIEKDRLFHPITSIPSVKVKAEWAQRYMLETLPFATRLVAFACVEGILFSSSFAAVFYFKSKRKLPGLCLSNEFIARDEGMHTEFACLLLSRLNNRPAESEIHAIVKGAVEVEQVFVRESLRAGLIGLSTRMMLEYVEFVADRLCCMLGVSELYKTANPLLFMEGISLQGKTNFFESRVSQYQLRGVLGRASMAKGGNLAEQVARERVFSVDQEF